MATVKGKTAAVLSTISLLLIVNGCSDNAVGFEEIPEDTFWELSDPASQQMNAGAINALEASVQQSENLLSFLVIRHGKLVSETYANGASATSLLHLRSITKCITGLLTGISIDKGYIESPAAYISDYFPEIPDHSAWDSVRVYHLLNMLSGMNWQEERDLNAYENRLNDPLPFIFSKELAYTPGTHFMYNSPGVHLLSHLIHKTTQSTPGAFAQEHLWAPMGINGYDWEKDGKGVERGGAGLELTARDLAKMGLLFLQGGRWEAEQLLPEAWITTSWEHPIRLADVGENRGSTWGYRNFWWTADMHGTRVHYADGYGGQLLLVAPEYDLIIVTNHIYRVDPDTNRKAFDALFDELLPEVFNSITG